MPARNLLAEIVGGEVGLTNTPVQKPAFAVENALDLTRSIYKAVIPKFLYKPPFGYPRFVDIPEIRRLAATPFVEMCIGTIIDEISAIPWDIVPDEDATSEEKTKQSGGAKPGKTEEKAETAPVDKAVKESCKKVRRFFENPNVNKENFSQQLKKFVRDLLEVNTGVWVKTFSKDQCMRELFVYDGGTFTMNPDMHGTLYGKAALVLPDQRKSFMNPQFWTTFGNPRQDYMTDLNEIAAQAAYFQYGWITGARPMPFGTREVVFVIKNPRSDELYGRGPMEVLLDTVQMLVYGIDHNLDYYTDNNIPKGVFQMIGATDDDLKAFAIKWREVSRVKNEVGDYRKRFHHMPTINQEGKFIPIGFSNAELELIQQQEWFSKLVWACFGVTPSELGFTGDSNRATEIVQSRAFRRKCIRPMLSLIEFHINSEIIPEFETGVWINTGSDEEDTLEKLSGIKGVKFKFDPYDVQEDIEKHQLYQLQLRNGIKTKNEIREDMGLQPVEGGDELGQSSPFGSFGSFGQTGESNDKLQEKPGSDKMGGKKDEEGKTMDVAPKDSWDGVPAQLKEMAIETKPFADYNDFDACVRANSDKQNPKAYCAQIHKQATGKWPSEKAGAFFESARETDLTSMADKPKALDTSSPIMLRDSEKVDTSKGLMKVFDDLFDQQEDAIVQQLKLYKPGKDVIPQIKDLSQTVIGQLKQLIDVTIADEAVRNLVYTSYLKALDKVEIEYDRNFIPNKDTLEFINNHAFENVKDMGEFMQSKLRKELEMGMMAGEGPPQLARRVKSVFKAGRDRADMIARTETIRAESAGAYDGYMQTGIKGKVQWMAKLDPDTCDYCKSLHGEKVDLGKNFEAAVKGKHWEGKTAPAHPNCRCRVVFVPD